MNNEYRSNYLIRSCAVSKPESHRCNSNGARRWARYLPAASLCDATPAQSSRTNHHCRYHSAVVLRHKKRHRVTPQARAPRGNNCGGLGQYPTAGQLCVSVWPGTTRDGDWWPRRTLPPGHSRRCKRRAEFRSARGGRRSSRFGVGAAGPSSAEAPTRFIVLPRRSLACRNAIRFVTDCALIFHFDKTNVK